MGPYADVVVASLAVDLIVAGFVWRRLERRRAVAVLEEALASPDREIRRAAIEVAGRQGVARYVASLVDLARRETDPGVSMALAETVARNQWAGADDPRLVELRVWAERRLATRPAVPPMPAPPVRPSAAVTGVAGTTAGR